MKGRREVERGGIGTWGRGRGKEKERKYGRNSKQSGRYVRERSLYKEEEMGKWRTKYCEGKG